METNKATSLRRNESEYSPRTCLIGRPAGGTLCPPPLIYIFTRGLPEPTTSVSSVVPPYPYSERPWILYDIYIRTRTLHCRSVCRVHITPYPGYLPRTKNFCNFCKKPIPVPGTSASSARRCHKDPGYGSSIYMYACPWLLEVLYASATLSRSSGSFVKSSYPYPNLLCGFCKTHATIPGVRVHHASYPPGTSVSYVCLCRNARNVWKSATLGFPIAETSWSSVTPPYPYPETTNPTEN